MSTMSPLAQRILFMDGEAILLDKPSGLPVDPPRDGSLSLENHLASLTFGFQRWPLAVHRLDRDTSGCLLLARNPKAHKRFAAAFEAGEVSKTYVAAVAGTPPAQEGIIDLPLTKISSAERGWRMVGSPKGKPALTRWRLVATVAAPEGERSLIACFPETGRTHQIRVHLAEGLRLGIIGDPVYGTPPLEPGAAMLLHARSLSIPRKGKPPVEGKAPLPDRFHAAGFTETTLTDAGL
ncbi:RNA pseudouridine synthase [Sphingobium jiangsuense]|uniref:tRNA pseudouridine32 synthase/23S rRNA pseudouridine746 synthase n=2 Tax=Sphingobium jiangsuense TaxID=870476 RepID=A0A7W6BIE0_9SPHN|nr:tRNA pseudouridine32 synthase/23S rRNA pseudouridine746 synthase [Sphingobium jiangsuense]GLS98770.1 RNA pseudouridine synthase [Sphingobium jiangsuense]